MCLLSLLLTNDSISILTSGFEKGSILVEKTRFSLPYAGKPNTGARFVQTCIMKNRGVFQPKKQKTGVTYCRAIARN